MLKDCNACARACLAEGLEIVKLLQMFTEAQLLKLRSLRRIKLGLTGCLACGKTTALKNFEAQGWTTFSADQMVAQIYKRQGLTKEALIARFGTTEAGLKRWEKWIHPLVKKEIQQELKKVKGPVVVEVPLLFEAQMQKLFDLVVVVAAPSEVRKKRALKRGMTAKLYRDLAKRQWSQAQKMEQADFVLFNLSKPALKQQVKALSSLLVGE
jgi:dephospho-CoA kinase